MIKNTKKLINTIKLLSIQKKINYKLQIKKNAKKLYHKKNYNFLLLLKKNYYNKSPNFQSLLDKKRSTNVIKNAQKVSNYDINIQTFKNKFNAKFKKYI